MAEKNVENVILSELQAKTLIEDSYEFSRCQEIEHTALVGHLKSLAMDEYVVLSQLERKQWVLTAEGQEYLQKGTPEYRLFQEIPAETGVLKEELSKKHEELVKFGLQNGMKKKWFVIDKAFIKRGTGQVIDEDQQILKKIHENPHETPAKEVLDAFKKRKLIELSVLKYYKVSKGPQFQEKRAKKPTDLTAEMIQSGSWKTTSFKQYNYNSLGKEIAVGNLHPLLKVRTQFREILLEMGFEEMPTNNYVESSFWNFDTLFQPQQHPARDAHDTFFLADPEKAKVLYPDYWERVKKMHEQGGEGSIGWRYDWSADEAKKNIFRTHTTAVSSRMLYAIAQEKEFRPRKLFSIDRVFRNENLDATHLAEFHQIEGVIADRNIGLAHLKGIIHEFFKKIGIKQLWFKPAYNPYTEPSMEIFGYHPTLKRKVEIGNSGVFRPEMLLPMGLPKDVNVIAWGLSLERPTMIQYNVGNIRDLIGYKKTPQMAIPLKTPFKELELQEFKLPISSTSEDLRIPLMASSQEKPVYKPDPTPFTRAKTWFRELFYGPDVSDEPRLIYLDGKVHPENKMVNIVKNQKYSVWTFLPMVLYNQFKFFFNLFFLLIALSQFIKPLKVGFLFSYVAPLVFVLLMALMKEAWDDYKRYKRDKEANSQQYNVLQESNRKTPTESAQLKVGDIIEVFGNQRIPADLILLHTADTNGTVFIKTDQLDGETDWKLRKAVSFTQNYVNKGKNLKSLTGTLKVSPPKQDIYEFTGLFKLEVGGGDGHREPLSLENTLWCNTVLSAGKILGLVIFTGKETRSSMNSREPRTKVGKIDLELNFLSKILFVFMAIVAFFIMLLHGSNNNNWLVLFFRYLLLLSSIIPISLRVNLDFAKLFFAYSINSDTDIAGTVARNSQIPEELGRIQFILTDKTGTLTQNDMIFKKLSLESIQYTSETLKDLEKNLRKNCEKFEGPLKDIEDRYAELRNEDFFSLKKRKHFRRDKENVIRDLVTALSLCHNVTPIVEDGQKVYQASSPDEIALVKLAEELKMLLISRDQQNMVIETPVGKKETYGILACFPFSSETKRMGIIVKHLETNRIIFYLKGADTIMKWKVPEVQRGFLQDECETLAREGLRTLVITQKYLKENDYLLWRKMYDDANMLLQNREAAVRKVVEQLEIDMEFLGVTGVEDKLQEDVCQTLESLKQAGINVWMLTGDKLETATCIAISAGLKSKNQELFVIKEMEDPLQIQNALNEFNNKSSNHVLIIDGVTLKTSLEPQHQKFFFEVACKAEAVICCRCSPTQKALITECIKQYTNKKTCSIGDGGNDVGMIQAADVGVGIVGKEGRQAALASDFSILKFKYLSTLLLWHGRLSYKRAAVMSQFVIHRGLIISIIQLVFIMMFYYVSIPIYNGMLMLGYATAFTTLPVFCLILDEDVTKIKALDYPDLYKSLQKGRELNVKTFLTWLWKSIYQGSMIMILSTTLFEKSFLNIVTITFTSLIIAELLNISTELSRFNWRILASQLGTLVLYVLCLVFLPQYLSLAAIDLTFVLNVLLITVISWLPLHIFKLLRVRFDPTENEKVMKVARTRFY